MSSQKLDRMIEWERDELQRDASDAAARLRELADDASRKADAFEAVAKDSLRNSPPLLYENSLSESADRAIRRFREKVAVVKALDRWSRAFEVEED